jgi:putative peptide zinc metalloprotease protein
VAGQFQSASWHRVADLAPRLRAHGQVGHHRYRGQTWYVLLDPSSGRAHRFTPAAYTFIRSMDGKRTVGELWTQMATDLEVDAPTQDEVIRLLSQLYEADMLLVDRLPNAEAFLHLVNRHRRSPLMNAIRSPLSITVPLWDPDPFLKRYAGLVRAVLGKTGLIVWLAVVMPAVVLAILNFRELTENATDRLLSAEGLLIITLTFPVVKALHELGHAFTLRALGGEVHQIGLMFIAFLPVPYVEASAAAILPSKAQRMLVGAAGMMVELVLGAGALYLWLSIEPGIIRAVAYDVIVIAGVSTLIVNGNPLLRFDGYFILSDLIEIPNLAQRSSRFWGNLLKRFLFGLRNADVDHDSRSERFWYATYGPASFVYRMFVLISLSLFIASEYFIVGVVFAVIAMISAIVVPLVRGVKRTLHLAQLQAASRRTKARLILASAVGVMAACLIPLPLHTNSEGIVWIPEDAYVRAGADGFVDRLLLESGTRVDKGVKVIENKDVFLASQIEINRERIRELEVRLLSERFTDRVRAELTKIDLAEERSKLDSNLDKQTRLTAQSERSGTFLVSHPLDLPGRFFAKGETLGYVVPDETATVRTIVLQDDIDLVRHSVKSARVMLTSNRDSTLDAHVVREVPAAGYEVPSKALSVSGGGALAVDPRDPKGLKVSRRVFQFDLTLSSPLPNPAFGQRVYVRFEHQYEPLAYQAYRRIRQLFLARFNA